MKGSAASGDDDVTAAGPFDGPLPDGRGSVRSAGTAPNVGHACSGSRHATQPLPCFALGALLDELRLHPELDLDTLAYHMRQCDATAADGYCHAAINEARSFLEALVVSIVNVVRREAGGNADGAPRDRSQNGTAFRTHRRYLLEAGFIDANENELLQYVYSIASAKGSHHGVADEAWCRLARRMVFAAGQYVIRRYGKWKRNGRAGASVPQPGRLGHPHARGGWVGRVIRALIGRA